MPGLFPVVRVGAIPGDQVADHLGVLATGRNGLEGGLGEPHRVALEERGGIERADKLTRIHAVAVVHHAAELLAHFDRKLRQARRDEARVIGLDLVINVIGALVEPRVA